MAFQDKERTVQIQLPFFEVAVDFTTGHGTSFRTGKGETFGGPILDRIQTPFDLRQLPMDQLTSLATKIRQLILDTVSRTGGHLASNLGTIELSIALHYVFDTPDDKLIWDVGHQAYTHKILTGRKKAFGTLRQHGGLSGFPRPSESCYDVFGAGHSSTSISAATGIAEACRMKGRGNRVIAVIGDGSLMSGMAFEGLNHAGDLKRDLIIVLNDNRMSISPNVGAISSYLSRIIAGQPCNHFRKEFRLIADKLPGLGDSVRSILRKSIDDYKGLLAPGMIFQELGFEYFGPFPGHRIELLIKQFRKAKTLNGPVLFHVVTKKGKGYEPAEKNPTLFHGVGAFDVASGKPTKSPSQATYTKVFGDTLMRIAEMDSRVVAVTAGMPTGTGLGPFSRKFPGRFYDVGIAEQHAVTFAAGMATEGFRPVVAMYSTFLQRAYDQILHDVCLQHLPVVFILDRAGLVGEDGPTHHGLFDISYLRSIPNLVFMAPKDENELQHMLFKAIRLSRPVAIRYPRGDGAGVPLDRHFCDLPLGKVEILRSGRDIAFLGIGSTVHTALEAAECLTQEGITSGVVNCRFIKPIDDITIRQMARECKLILTIEENVLQGGFGSAVLETLKQDRNDAEIHCIGIPDVFVEQGPQNVLRKKYGLDRDSIVKTAKKMLDRIT